MAVQDLGLAQLFPLTTVSPLDLPAIARLEESSKGDPRTADAIRRVLGVFKDMMGAQGLWPVLCELAVISDKVEWRPTQGIRGRRFVSVIDVYDKYLSPEEGQELASAWVTAIRSLSIKGQDRAATDAIHRDSNFIVLNPLVYNTFSFRQSMRPSRRISTRQSRQRTAPPHISLPDIKMFRLESTADEPPAGSLANKSINLLLKNTARSLSHSTREKMNNCYLVIVPFSRPYLDASDFERRHRDKVSADAADGNLFTSYPASSKDPGGCFFGIYYSPLIATGAVADFERRFYLQAQYLLTLSALVEARRNLLLYYEEQVMKDWGYLLHQVKNDIHTPTEIVKKWAKEHEGASDLQFAVRRLDLLNTMANLSSKVIKARIPGMKAEPLMEVAALRRIRLEVGETLRAGASLVSEEWRRRGSKNDLPLYIDFIETELSQLKRTYLLEGSHEAEPLTEFEWIGDLHKLICHEVANSIGMHAERKEVDGVNLCASHWGLVAQGGILRLIVENLVPDRKSARERVESLAAHGPEFKRSTGLGQMRLGLSGELDLGDLDVAVCQEDKELTYQVSVPIGRYRPKKEIP